MNDVDDVTAFVLAGGKSTRMGKDKAFLEFKGRILLARALELAVGVTEEVRIVGDPRKFAAFGRAIEDLYRERGPLGGIHAALKSSSTDLNLMLAVDLPFVQPNFLKYLISIARETKALAIVPRASDGLQPLCAVYRREFGQAAEQSLAQGKNKIDALFANVETRIIEPDELSHAGFTSQMFRNLNTPEEFEKAANITNQEPKLETRS
jgi:molybdopterin-guanine dinucleotide biosynthesis protein A